VILGRETLVRLRNRAVGPTGREDDPPVFRAVEHVLLGGTPQGMIGVRAWLPPWSGDSWPEYHRPYDLEPSPADPRSRAEVEMLPQGELVSLLVRLQARMTPAIAHELAASDLDLLAELPRHWEAHGTLPSAGAWSSAEKVAAFIVERLEGARKTVVRRRAGVGVEARGYVIAAAGLLDLLAELQLAQAEAYEARHAWTAELRMAKVAGRKPADDVRRRRAVARARAKICHRFYVAALNAEA
jgi:hypothetical protein